ncbi:MAG: HEAT repeat domain-containing protein [Sedimentisphaerales bacterium]|nr:HEAT repeat domain-containing protein [Sedimentisphaerales bacterium]
MKLRKYILLIILIVCITGQAGISKKDSSEIIWGNPESGLEAGITLENPKQLYRPGESVDFALSIRNVSEDTISLEYTENPLREWAPDVYDTNMKSLPVMPAILTLGGRIIYTDLKPGEIITIARGTFQIKPLGWEGKIDKTIVFAETGKYRVCYTLKFGPYHYRPADKYPWAGELTTGRQEFQVDTDKSGFKAQPFKGVSKADMQAILSLLGDHTKQHPIHFPMDEDMERWKQIRENWQKRCSTLTMGAVEYLAHIAVNYPDDDYRALACNALGETGKKQVIPSLVKCLLDSSPAARQAAARSLGQLRSVDSIPEIQKLLQDESSSVRANAAYALGHIGSRDATKALLEAFKKEKDRHAKMAMSLALGWIADPAALPALKEELREPTEIPINTLRGAIRNIEEPDYWGLGVKGGISEHELYRLLVDDLDLSDSTLNTEKAKSEILDGPDRWAAAFQGPQGIVYYLAKKNIFYVRQKKDSGDDIYFGPFEGNPHDIVRPARQALEKSMERR